MTRAPQPGDRISYRRTGASFAGTTYTGTVVDTSCDGCSAAWIHTRTDAGALHHVPPEAVVQHAAEESPRG